MRLRSTALLVVAALAAAVAAACIPDRDNPDDPVNVPDSSFVIAPIEGTAHTLFQLTVTATAGASYHYDLDGNGTFETEGASTLQTELPLSASAFGESGVGAVERTVRVRVEHAHSSSESSAGVILRNAAPVLDAGASVLVVSAWEQATVRLDVCGEVEPCPSKDPDGPAGLRFSWRQVRGTPVLAGIVSSGQATFLAPAEPQTLLFLATADDGFASVTAPLEVQVSHPVWVNTTDPLRLYRLHTESRLRTLPNDLGGFETAWIDPDNGDAWLSAVEIVAAAPDEIEVARIDAAGTILGRWPFPSDTSRIATAFGGDSGGWALRQSSTTNELEVFRLNPIPTGTAGTVSFVSLPFNYPRQLLPDPAEPGGAVVLKDLASARIDSDGVVSALPGPGIASPILATVANDGAIWGCNPFLDATVSRLLLDGTVEEVTFPGQVAAELLPGIDGVLVMFATTASTLASIASIDSDMRVVERPAAPIPLYFGSGTAAGNGEIWNIVPPERTARRLAVRENRWQVVAEGGLESLGLSDSLSVSVADPWGGGLLVTSMGSAPGETAFARVPSNLDAFELAVASYGTVGSPSSTEPARGSLWVPGGFVGHVVRQDIDGRILAVAETPGNATAAFGLLDGGVAVAWGPSFLDDTSGMDLRDGDGVFVSRAALPNGSQVGPISATFDGSVVCLASLPDQMAYRIEDGIVSVIPTNLGVEIQIAASSNGACWTISDNNLLRRTDATGSQSFMSGVFAIAPDPFGDGVWITYDDGGGAPFPIRWVDDTGSIVAGFDLPGDPTSEIRVTRACAAASAVPPYCREVWVAIGSQAVYRFDGNGGVLDSWIVPAGTLTDLIVR